jgi:hypothetical protein
MLGDADSVIGQQPGEGEKESVVSRASNVFRVSLSLVGSALTPFRLVNACFTLIDIYYS